MATVGDIKQRSAELVMIGMIEAFNMKHGRNPDGLAISSETYGQAISEIGHGRTFVAQSPAPQIGFKSLTIMGVPVIVDSNVPAGAIYVFHS